MSMVTGNSACTTGLSKRIYDAILAAPSNGLPGSPSAAQSDALKAICFGIAQAVVAEITTNAVADPGVGNFAIQ